MKKLFLLDGHALVYRAHYAFMTRPLINSKGWNVSCITGFTRTLLELLKKEKPSHIAVAFDLPGGTFRDQIYEAYKANRDAQPEDISFGIPYIKRILEGMNIPIVTKDGFEADDVIGTLAKQAEKEGFEVYMMTPDKDYGQLVSDKIFMYKPARSGNEVEVWGVKEVIENWGIKRVDQVIDMLGLQGDSVDNIPGIPGIGPKTAATLLAQYDNLEGIIANAHQLKGKQQENVVNFAEQGRMSKILATIDLNVPIQFHEESYRHSEINREALSEVFKELEFKSIGNEMLGTKTEVSETAKPTIPPSGQMDLFGNTMGDNASASDAPSSAAPPLPSHSVADKNIQNTSHTYHLTDTKESRAALIQTLSQAEFVCFDSETTNIDANQAELVGLSFAVKPYEAYYIPFPANQQEAQAILEEFRPIFENPAIKKVGQNLKYDLIILKWYNIEVKGVDFDTMIAHYLIEPELRHGMDYLSETYLHYSPVSIETLIGKGKNQLSMRDIDVSRVKDYAAEDADVTFQLFDYFRPQLGKENLDKLFRNIEIPLVQVLVDLEYEGIRIDPVYLDNYSKELAIEITKIENKVYEQAGVRFNISSPKQVGDVLFDRLKIPYRWKKTGKTDQYSTDEEKLSELAFQFPVARTILDYRSLSKLQSTYVEALPRMINPKTGRVHSSFNQALAATGRLSSNNPNLQNIPIRTAEGRKVREAFIPRSEEYVLLSADYSQIELRLIAEISNEQAMLSAFQAGHDIHQATAAKVYGVPLEEVTPTQRRNAKTVNFSIIYGAGATNLSQQLSIPRSEAKHLIDQYFAQYKDLKTYMGKVVEDARENGYVMTLMGRRRYLRDIDSRNSLARSNAERVAVNTPIQGSAADMIKIAMINIHRELKARNLKTKMILQVHDELVFDVHKSEIEIVKPIIESGMKNAIPNLKVPILVEMGVGDHWLDAH